MRSSRVNELAVWAIGALGWRPIGLIGVDGPMFWLWDYLDIIIMLGWGKERRREHDAATPRAD